jgi:hypothetical protein
MAAYFVLVSIIFSIILSEVFGLKQNLKIFDRIKFSFASAIVSSTVFLGSQPSFGLDSVNFQKFLELLDTNAVEKVVFKGINPKYVVITLRDGGKVAEVRDGFPFYDDPLSEFLHSTLSKPVTLALS